MDKFLRSLVEKPVAAMPAGWEALAKKLAGGDLSVVLPMAELLDSELEDQVDYALIYDIYKWLVDHGHPKLAFQLIRLRHLIECSTEYTNAEVEAVFDCCEVYPAQVLPLLHAIVMGDPVLFLSYKDRILTFVDKLLVQSTDALTTSVAEIVCTTLRLKALKQEESEQKILDQQSKLAASAQKYVVPHALNELDYAVTSGDYEELCRLAGSNLKRIEELGGDKGLPFYKGLIALAMGHYADAYGCFQQGGEDGAKVGAAYCLVHAIGVEQDLAEARSLLEQVTQDGYVLYVKGISYYKEHTPEGTSKALELLAQSLRLGYQPALEASLMIRYAALFEGDFSIEQLEAFVADQKGQVPDALLGGLAAHVAFVRALAHGQAVLKERPSIVKEDPNWTFKDEVFKRGREELETFGTCSSLLFLYSKAKFDQLSLGQEDLREAMRTVLSYNQSPLQRRRALDATLISALAQGNEPELSVLLHVFKEFGGELDDVLALSTVGAWCKPGRSTDFQKAILDRLAEHFTKQSEPLARLLLAWLHATQSVSHPDLSLVLRCVKEITAESEDLCVTLRNAVVTRCGLSRDLPVVHSALQMPMASRRWLDQLIGYAFYDYNV